MAAPSCSRRPSGCTGWWRALPAVWSTGGSPGRSGTRWQSCSASGSSALPCGHPDGNDADHLADDPIHKLLLGRDPVAGEALASQPTISRFENGVGRSALYELARELAMRVIERHQRRLDGRARRITIDLDPTDDATHGASSSPSSTGTTTAGATCRCWRF